MIDPLVQAAQAAPAEPASRPAHVVLGVNNFCNLRCVMCDVGTGNGETNFGGNLTGASARSMPIDLFRRIVDDMADFCPDARLGLAFTEPLAWRPLGEALAYASAIGLYTTVTTNGLVLPRRAGELAGGRCRELFVSLDGPEAVHDRIRRHPGSYARAVEGIKAVSALEGAPDISVFCTITEWNVGTLKDFLLGMSSLPLKQVGLMHNNFVTGAQAEAHNLIHGADFTATASNVFDSDPGRIDLDRLASELGEIGASTFPMKVRIQPNLAALDDLITYYHRPEVFIGRRCNDVHRIMMIDSDGEAIPVHGRCYRYPIANIHDTSLQDIWGHEKIAALRTALDQAGGLLPACSRCCGGFG